MPAALLLPADPLRQGWPCAPAACRSNSIKPLRHHESGWHAFRRCPCHRPVGRLPPAALPTPVVVPGCPPCSAAWQQPMVGVLLQEGAGVSGRSLASDDGPASKRARQGSMESVYICAAVRTPLGAFLGSLSPLAATDLGAAAIRAAVQRAGVPPEAVGEVYMGNVCSANLGQAPARQAALKAGLPLEVDCTTVNKVCSSGAGCAGRRGVGGRVSASCMPALVLSGCSAELVQGHCECGVAAPCLPASRLTRTNLA